MIKITAIQRELLTVEYTKREDIWQEKLRLQKIIL